MKAKYFIALFASALFLVRCASAPVEEYSFSVTPNAPTVVRSVEDLPKPSQSMDEIKRTGVLRVISQSAEGQKQYDALTAAKLVAQKDILRVANGIKMDYYAMEKRGEIVSDELKGTINGHLRALDCGAFYDTTIGVAYACMEIPMGKPKKAVVK